MERCSWKGLRLISVLRLLLHCPGQSSNRMSQRGSDNQSGTAHNCEDLALLINERKIDYIVTTTSFGCCIP